jgi:hypothetical protein
MTATVLMVDDEADLEKLILQKFRRRVREGALSILRGPRIVSPRKFASRRQSM